jgi:hypothetical protein
MSKCHDIQKLLPLYEEGILADAEKQAVEDHLARCADCRREVTLLQKADRLVKNLSSVEEPPWFQQRIMARVRAEAGKKSFWQKWLSPLGVKVPVQIMATIVIAVLAVYIYRSGDDQVQRILPGALPPEIEGQVQRTPAPAPVPEVKPQASEEVSSTVVQKKSPALEKRKKDKDTEVPSNDRRLREKEMPETKSEGIQVKGDSIPKESDKAEEPLSQTLQAQGNEFKSAPERMPDSEREPAHRASTAMERKKEAYKMAAPSAVGSMAPSAAVKPQASIFLLADDPDAASEEAEKILARHGARKVTKRITQGRTVIRAEISGREWKEVLSKFKRIGIVEERSSPGDAGEPLVPVLIEVSGH